MQLVLWRPFCLGHWGEAPPNSPASLRVFTGENLPDHKAPPHCLAGHNGSGKTVNPRWAPSRLLTQRDSSSPQSAKGGEDPESKSQGREQMESPHRHANHTLGTG